MDRFITEKLLKWKESENRKPLILRGARQVGKTYSVKEFGKKHFTNLVTLDFEKKTSLKRIFSGDINISDIIKLISLELDVDIIPGKTLLFLDEIQLASDALRALRYFYEDLPELHVIAAGSLLEFEMEKIAFPVGRVEFMFMYPLTFAEFLQNKSERFSDLLPNFNSTEPLHETIHLKLLELLKHYFMVGGMPEAVKSYLEQDSFRLVNDVHDSLYQSFIQDIIKYESRFNVELVREILDILPTQVGNQVKYTSLSGSASIYKVKEVLKVLEKCLLVNSVQSSSASGLPLGGHINKQANKFCFLDIGLMQHICGISAIDFLKTSDLLATYQGALCEQFVGQEIIAAGGSQNRKLYYWSRAKKGSTAELDYLLARDGKIIPIEVKNGPAGKLKSLHVFIDKHPNIEKAVVLNSGNIGKIDKLHFFPLYTKFPSVS